MARIAHGDDAAMRSLALLAASLNMQSMLHGRAKAGDGWLPTERSNARRLVALGRPSVATFGRDRLHLICKPH